MSVLSTHMSDEEDFENAEDRLKGKYPGWLDNHDRHSPKLARRMIHFDQASPREKRIILRKNYYRRLEVCRVILDRLSSGPQSFTYLLKAAGGSRSTITNCLKGMCVSGQIQRNILTRKYELADSNRSRALTVPSTVYGPHSFRYERVSFNGKYAASFFPRQGLVRIDESLPDLDTALIALLKPVYLALRKPRRTPVEIEINIKVKGRLTVRPSANEKLREKWKSKTELWDNDRKLSKGY